MDFWCDAYERAGKLSSRCSKISLSKAIDRSVILDDKDNNPRLA